MTKKQIVCLVTVGMSALLMAADWSQFRGPQSRGVAADSEVPQQWSATENVAWRADLPGRGPSSPIVVDGHVIVTCSDGARQQQLMVLCFDAESGKLQWRRQFWATGRTLTHPTSAVAAPTPASDGKRVFAFFSSNDMACLDLEGNLLWYRGLGLDYPKAGNDVGMASSPLVAAQTVVVQVESQGDSFAAALDATTGKTRWRVARPHFANWSSPIVLPGQHGRITSVLFQSPEGLAAHDIMTGKQLWTWKASCPGIPSPVASNGRVFFGGNGLTALEIDPNSTSPKLLWDSSRLRPGSPSPVVHKNRLYALQGGVLKCAAADSGDIEWQMRLQGSYWATPVVAGDFLIAVDRDGVSRIVRLGKKGTVVAQCKLGEPIQATPAVADNALFLRSDRHLWKIAAEAAGQ